VAEKLGIDLVWFGVLLAVNMQTSFMHPPFGFALFYLRSVAPDKEYTDKLTKKLIKPVTTDADLLGCGAVRVAIQIIMVADTARNSAFDAALRRSVVPGCRVLDIGAGSGLLALMAARAGAAEVVSCEVNAAVAATATEIVERNGYADRIRIVARHSRDLEIGTDLAGPADIIVSEIVSNNLLGENILGTMEDVVGRLGHPATRVIPSHGCVRIALAHYANLASRQTTTVEGFDLSPMNGFAARIQLSPGNEALALRSAPEDLFSFDFRSGGPFPSHRASVGLTSTGGAVNGIVQWFRLTMDAEGAYENRPAPGASSSWSVMFQPLPSAIASRPGDRFVVHGGRDQTSVWMWLDPPARETTISAGT
jgi:type II protein arginine methyltransferase